LLKRKITAITYLPDRSHLYDFLTELSRHRLFFWGGLALAFILRIFALLALEESLYSKFLLWDEGYYHEWAQAILLNSTGSSYHEYAPLPAYLMAFIYKLFGPEIVFIRYANILLGTGSCWLIYLIGKELTGKWYALIALFCAALCKPLIFFSVVPLKTSLAVLLFGLLVYLVLLNRREDRWWNRIFLGAVFGLIFNVRPNVLILLPVLPFLLCSFAQQRLQYLKNLAKAGIFFAAGIVLSISPFAIHNYQVNGHLQILPVQSGFLLYANNNLSRMVAVDNYDFGGRLYAGGADGCTQQHPKSQEDRKYFFHTRLHECIGDKKCSSGVDPIQKPNVFQFFSLYIFFKKIPNYM